MPQRLLKKRESDVLILTESGRTIGYGHLTRSASIAEHLKKNGVPVSFIIHGEVEHSFFDGYDYTVLDWCNNLERLQLEAYRFILVDSYLADRDVTNRVFKKNQKVAFYDDGYCLDYPAGFIFNGLVYAGDLKYANKNAKYFLGPRYLPVREEFNALERITINREIKNVYLCVGSNAAAGIVPCLTGALDKMFKNIQINIVGEINSSLQGRNNNINIFNSITALQVRDLMQEADIGIGNGGQVSSELAKTGLPSILYCVVDNQERNIEYLVKNGMVLRGGSYRNSLGEVENIFRKSLEKIRPVSTRSLLSNVFYSVYNFNGAENIANVIIEACHS